MHCNNIWMLSDDTGELPGQPELSILVRAAAYRDAHLHRAWGRPETRPLVPVSFLMTHGIIFTASRYAAAGDTLEEFADHVMMYSMRGTQLKEWYINPGLLTPDQWQALGRATRWSEEHLATLANAVMVGGDPARGRRMAICAGMARRGSLVCAIPRLPRRKSACRSIRPCGIGAPGTATSAPRLSIPGRKNGQRRFVPARR